ncbi:hypothetical protein TNCT_361331 [Trichonephila clavata]|uniref:Uncharacterized protein n=1 Tax=Trichonephila clavata TaxID=2740835 RepID=A0A8X6KRT6_TRICU|nr:hypothetical protein TNCT_361331 [Trichonephila clavata]
MWFPQSNHLQQDFLQPCNEATEQALPMALDNVRCSKLNGLCVIENGVKPLKYLCELNSRVHGFIDSSLHQLECSKLYKTKRNKKVYGRGKNGREKWKMKEKRDGRVSMETRDGAIGSVEQEMRTREEDAEYQY